LVELLRSACHIDHIDLARVRDAIARRAAFNVVRLATAFLRHAVRIFSPVAIAMLRGYIARGFRSDA